MPRHKKEVQKPEETLESKIERVMEHVLEGFAFIPPEMLRIGDVAKMLSMSTSTVNVIKLRNRTYV